MNFVMVLIYTFVSSHPFTAKRAFQALSIINILRMPLQLIPFIIGGLVQVRFLYVANFHQVFWNVISVYIIQEHDIIIGILDIVF